jgi:hypothetical protein
VVVAIARSIAPANQARAAVWRVEDTNQPPRTQEKPPALALGAVVDIPQERASGMPVDTLSPRFDNPHRDGKSLSERQQTLERALEEAVSRALRDNLAPLQRTADELQQAYADLVAACSSSRPSNALPAMLRAQTAASALAAGLSVLSNFVAVALNPGKRQGSQSSAAVETADEELPLAAVATETSTTHAPAQQIEHETRDVSSDAEPETAQAQASIEGLPPDTEIEVPPSEPAVTAAEVDSPAAAVSESAEFDIASLPANLQDLHRRANRVAKVAMQDIKLLRPKDVRLGRENKDICQRLRSDLDKARKEYDRRCNAILDHPVDYFHRWMVEILAEGDAEALGEYPYPSPVLRH